MDYTRIIAIFILTFCTTILATGFDTTSAVINGVLMAGIAASSELIKDCDKKGKSYCHHGLIFQKVIDKALIL